MAIRLKFSTRGSNNPNWNFLPSFVPLSGSSAALFIAVMCVIPVLTGTVPMNLHTGNLDEVLNGHELVFVNFYADWCRFSQMLQPIFDEASNKVAQEIPTPGKVAFGKVDCENEPHLSQQYKVTKYPTIKLIRFGKTLKREYRGQRSVDAITTYIKEQLKDPIHEHQSIAELESLDSTKTYVIGYYSDKNSPLYHVYQKVASILRDDCEFHSVIHVGSAADPGKPEHIEIKAPEGVTKQYPGSLGDFDAVSKWISEECIPLVREITFNNAEELTEEGLPFMILFYHPEHDSDVIKRFKKAVSEQLAADKTNINCLTADGTKFTHPLHHLGKAVHDLPILAIDSFRHMYLFNKDAKQSIDAPGALKNFLNDLQSGKLHREFHHGPDPVQPSHEPEASTEKHLPKNAEADNVHPPGHPKDTPTDPPESTFAKLLPSRNRYTIIRDEL